MMTSIAGAASNMINRVTVAIKMSLANCFTATASLL